MTFLVRNLPIVNFKRIAVEIFFFSSLEAIIFITNLVNYTALNPSFAPRNGAWQRDRSSLVSCVQGGAIGKSFMGRRGITLSPYLVLAMHKIYDLKRGII